MIMVVAPKPGSNLIINMIMVIGDRNEDDLVGLRISVRSSSSLYIQPGSSVNLVGLPGAVQHLPNEDDNDDDCEEEYESDYGYANDKEPSTTCSMLGLGGCGLRKNQIAEAKFNQVVATSSGFSKRMLALPKMALEKAP